MNIRVQEQSFSTETLCAICSALLLAASAKADVAGAPGNRVAVLPSDHHATEFDGHLAAIGAETVHLSYEDFYSGRAFDNIDTFDVVAVPPLFNYRGEFGRIPTNAVGVVFGRLRDWVKEGGVLFVPDANYPYPMANDWFRMVDPGFVLSSEDCKCDCRMPAAVTPAGDTFGPDELGAGLSWNHLVFENPRGWETLTTCGHGRPTTAVRKYGKGLVVFSVLRQNYSEYFRNLLWWRFKARNGRGPVPADGAVFVAAKRLPQTPSCTAEVKKLRGGMVEVAPKAENLRAMPPVDVVLGVYRLLCEARAKHPESAVVLREIRAEKREDARAAAIVNRELAKFADGETVLWLGKGIQTSDSKMTSRILNEGYGNHNWWLDRLQRNRREILASGGEIDIVLLGDSITEGWEGSGARKLAELRQKFSVLSAGYSGDTVPTLLWRVENGELDGFKAKIVMVMIGTNDAQWIPGSTPESIADGIRDLVKAVRRKQPDAKILVSSVFPRGEKADDPFRLKVAAVNRSLDGIADGKTVFSTDFSKAFISADGTISKSLMPDFLHPGPAGYDIWFDAVRPFFSEP